MTRYFSGMIIINTQLGSLFRGRVVINVNKINVIKVNKAKIGPPHTVHNKTRINNRNVT